jgi:hypothetical protein
VTSIVRQKPVEQRTVELGSKTIHRDHIVSSSAASSRFASSANLWPEAANPRPGFHEKDRVENELHRRACAGAIAFADAQREIATNWLTL